MIAPRDRDDRGGAEEPVEPRLDEEELLLDGDETPLEEMIEEVSVVEIPVAILVLKEALPDVVLVAVLETEFAEFTVVPGELNDDAATEPEDDEP